MFRRLFRAIDEHPFLIGIPTFYISAHLLVVTAILVDETPRYLERRVREITDARLCYHQLIKKEQSCSQ